MNYTLNSTVLSSGTKIKNAIILCHGYGGDGKDISIVAHYWKNFLPDTIFICPDAPEVCKVNPKGFQWFDLMNETEDEILSKSLIAEAKLNTFIDEDSNDQLSVENFNMEVTRSSPEERDEIIKELKKFKIKKIFNKFIYLGYNCFDCYDSFISYL